MSAPTGQPQEKPKGGIDTILDMEAQMLPPIDEPPPEAPETTPAVDVPAPATPAIGEPPVPVVPPQAPPPAAATPPPAPAVAPPVTPAPTTAAPATPPAEPEPQRDGSPWKAAREAQRTAKEAQEELNRERARLAALEARERELLAQLEAGRAAPTATAPDLGPPADDDPLTNAERRIAQLELRAEEQRVTLERQTRNNSIAAQEQTFVQAHPDYFAARDFYIQKETRIAEERGEIEPVAANIRAKARPLVEKVANDMGITQAEASRRLAIELIADQRITMMTQAAAAAGETVAARVYRLAVDEFGYKGNGNGAPVTTTTPAPVVPEVVATPANSAAEMLRQQAAQATGASLATMPHVGSPAPNTLTHAGLIAMPAQQMDRMIEYMDRAAHLGLCEPDWMERATSGQVIHIPTAEEMRIANGG